jgi:cytidylate kinase
MVDSRMPTRVVCIAHTTGAGAEPIARAVAQRLRFRFVDDEILTKAAQKAGVGPEDVARVEERQSVLARFLDALSTTAPVVGALHYLAPEPMAVDYHLIPVATAPIAGSEAYRALIREVIHEVAAEGSVVILAHAASIALGATPGTLRVLVTASEETRLNRLSAAGQLLNEAQAAAAIAEADRARASYFLTFYGIRDETPTLYDLVINTDVLSPEQVLQTIVHAALS